MRAIKTFVTIVAIILLGRYFPVLYYASEFNDFVNEEPRHTRVATRLHQVLLELAQSYFLPVQPIDIRIREEGLFLQATVDYTVPIDLFFFTHRLSFHASGIGIASAR
jgi:hypothetical protein